MTQDRPEKPVRLMLCPRNPAVVRGDPGTDRSAATRRVDGLILMPTSPSQGYLVTDVLAGLAVVAVDRPVTGADVDTVVVDNLDGAAAATRHLAGHGHERIACGRHREDRGVSSHQHRRGREFAAGRAALGNFRPAHAQCDQRWWKRSGVLSRHFRSLQQHGGRRSEGTRMPGGQAQDA